MVPEETRGAAFTCPECGHLCLIAHNLVLADQLNPVVTFTTSGVASQNGLISAQHLVILTCSSITFIFGITEYDTLRVCTH
jgi:hypothetical protein